MLFELIGGIGSAIASATLKLWLKDSPMVEAVGSKICDLLGKKIPDLLVRNNVERAFHSIQDQAADSVLKLLKKEKFDLPDDRLLIVANAAGVTLDNTPISSELLLVNNLNPEELVEYFSGRSGQEGGNPGLVGKGSSYLQFSEKEKEAYLRILSHASQLIVDMSSAFPHFEVRMNSEVLQRLNSMAHQVIEGMNLVVAEQDDAFEADYRNACVRKFDQLELFGVDLQESNQRYNLSIAYVTLMLEQRRSDVGGDEIRHAISAEGALAENNRLFVRGAAGSGKTTLLQWFSVFASARRLHGELEPLNDCVPFIIKLRNFSDAELPTPEQFPLEAGKNIIGKMPQGWVQARLESGRALVLIDGLDEAPEHQRKKVRQWLRELMDCFPQARYIVTSRPHAAEEGWLDAESFIDAELQDMALVDVDEFICHWHDSVAAGMLDESEKGKLSDLARSLQLKIREKPAILRLATSPLLCALLCALHRQRVRNLPSDRIELYRACIEMFFRRDEERDISSKDYIKISDRQKESILQDFAWWMIRNGKTAASPEDAKARFTRSYNRIRGEKPVDEDGGQILKLFLQRIGIVRMLSHQKIDFPHRTFQEYLAARAAVEEDDLGMLIDNAHDDQWREVVILAAGVLTPARAEALVKGLLSKGDVDVGKMHSLYMVAVAALDMIVAPPEGSTIEDEVGIRLESIVPPRSIAAAKELVVAGDLVVPYLARRSGLKSSQAAACVRALALIGTEQAYEVIQGYGRDLRPAVIDQFGVAFKYVSNPEKYVDKCGKFIRRLNFTNHRTPDIGLLSRCENLVALDLWGTAVSDISPLTACVHLQDLNLGCTAVNDISAVLEMPKLVSLNLLMTGIERESIDDMVNQMPNVQIFHNRGRNGQSERTLTSSDGDLPA